MNQDTERSEIKTIRDHPIADTIGKRSYLPKTSSLLISLAILGLLILVSGFVQKREYIPGPTNLRQAFPRTIGEYKSTEDAPIDQEILDELELTDYLNRTYLSPKGYAVHLYVGYVNSQNEMPLIHTPVGCLPGGGNAILSHEAVPWWQAPAGRGQAGQQEPSQNINLIRLASGEEKQIVIYWYQERGVSFRTTGWKGFIFSGMRWSEEGPTAPWSGSSRRWGRPKTWSRPNKGYEILSRKPYRSCRASFPEKTRERCRRYDWCNEHYQE